MEKKLIFLDIDGTLTKPGSNVPPASAQQAVSLARAGGHKVVLCSGRNYGMLSPLLNYGFDGLVGSAGGYIEYGGKVVYDCPMTTRQRDRAMAVLEQSGIYRTVESRTGTYTDEGLKSFLRETARSSGNSELLRWREQLEHELGIRPMGEYGGEPIYKIGFVCRRPEDLREPRRVLEGEFSFCVQDGDAAGTLNGELINRKFNKGTAVRRLSEYLDIPLEHTIAFGDSMNDLEMIETAGLGICMGNGSPQLKQRADTVCPPVGEDGLYRTFLQYGLI